jgi:two-component system response regulator QseB
VTVSGAELEPSHVLVVEDEPMIGRILEHKLTREGYRVTWARSAAEAADVLRSDGQLSSAIVDLTLERDAVELMTEMSGTLGLRWRGWIALAAVRDLAAQQRASGGGAAAVVTKPFKPTAVAATVRRLLAEAPP